MTGTSSATRSYSGSSGLTRRTARKTWHGNNHSNLDKQAKTRAKRDHIVLNKQRKHAIDGGRLRRFLSSIAPVLGIEGRSFSIVLITDENMRTYNRDYRGFDKPTDVLSFRGGAGYLGDILISAETAYTQARKSSTLNFETNIRRLILHGLLHLMGYDHETDSGEMRAIERRLRRRFQC
jgi:probable rRNA maturation factor